MRYITSVVVFTCIILKMKILQTLRTLGTLCFVVEFIVIVLVWQSSSMADPESAGGLLDHPWKTTSDYRFP